MLGRLKNVKAEAFGSSFFLEAIVIAQSLMPTMISIIKGPPNASHDSHTIHEIIFSRLLYVKNLPRLSTASSALSRNSVNFLLSIDFAIFLALGAIASKCW